jgi:hypothetical protein
MRTWIAACAIAACATLLCNAETRAEKSDACAVPGYLLFGDSLLERVNAAVKKDKALKILVIGTTSSTLPGPHGASYAYPARLQAALQSRLPGVAVTVVTRAKPRQFASEMAEGIEKLLLDEKPNLVLWQTGTFDAVRGVDPEEFRAGIADGVETMHAGGADVILLNMQYSPRTESMVALGPYADGMRWVAREREVPLFDRLAVMRHWYDSGQIDLYAATKDIGTAKLVHGCIGRALASMIIDAARLDALEGTTSQ